MVRLSGKKAGIFALMLALAVSLYAVFIFQVAKEKERKKRISKEFELSELKKIKETLELKLDRLNNEKSILSSRQEELEKEIELLKARLRREKENKEAISQKLKTRSQELDGIRAELEKETRENKDLFNNLEKLQRDYDRLQLQFKESQSANRKLKEKINAFALESVRRKKEMAKIEETTSGKVLLVNEEFNFIVVNLGRRDGLKIGDELLVFRDNRNVGETFVEKIYDVISIATFSSPLKENIKTGDKIKLRRME